METEIKGEILGAILDRYECEKHNRSRRTELLQSLLARHRPPHTLPSVTCILSCCQTIYSNLCLFWWTKQTLFFVSLVESDIYLTSDISAQSSSLCLGNNSPSNSRLHNSVPCHILQNFWPLLSDLIFQPGLHGHKEPRKCTQQCSIDEFHTYTHHSIPLM